VVAARAGVAGASAEIAVWLVLTAAGLVACGLLLGNMHASRGVADAPPLGPMTLAR
jgi:hypothetical protein